MAYDRQKIFEQAKEMTVKNKLIFIEDIVTLLPISKETFYTFYPLGSDELDELKSLLEKNKTDLKVSMRNKWYKSENATLQMGLMKLICTTEERKKLSMTYNEEVNQQPQKIIIEGVSQAFIDEHLRPDE